MGQRWVRVGVIGLLVVAAACGGGGGSSKPTAGTNAAANGATTPPVTTTALGTGVDAQSVKVGVMMIDFNCVEQFVDSLRPDQQQAFQVYVDDINQHGGINGRKLVPVYKTYCPINNNGELQACTSLTEDSHVFATIGIFYDPTGDAQLCFAKQHKTVVVADSLTEALEAKAPGLLLTPNISAERRLRVIMSLIKEQHTLDGKKVAIVSDLDNKSRATKVVAPALQSLGLQRGTDGALSISGSDTTQAQTQVDSLVERWKGEGTNAVVLVGEDVTAKQFVEKMKAGIPDLLIVADNTSILDAGREEQKAHVSPNPYDGAISAEGDTGVEHTKTPAFAYCRDIYEKATGKKIPSPNVVVKLPNGKQNDIYGEVEDACLFVTFFSTIARKVGPYLNDDNWVQSVNTYGSRNDTVPPLDTSTRFASLHQGKYDADDTYGLVRFDPKVGEDGDWDHVTPVENVTGS